MYCVLFSFLYLKKLGKTKNVETKNWRDVSVTKSAYCSYRTKYSPQHPCLQMTHTCLQLQLQTILHPLTFVGTTGTSNTCGMQTHKQKS